MEKYVAYQNRSSEPPPRFPAPRQVGMREGLVRSTVSVGGGRSPPTLGRLSQCATRGRWKQLLDNNANVRTGLWFKELATLPPQARQAWTEYAHPLTDREVTHLCFLILSPGSVVQLGLPLILVVGT